MTGALWAAVLALFALAALLNAAETAVFNLSASRIRTLREEGFRGAEALGRVRADPAPIHTGIRLAARGFSLLGLGIAVADAAIRWGIQGAVVELAVGVVLVLVLTDILPRLAAIRSPVRLALMSAGLVERVGRLLFNLTAPLIRLEERLAGEPGDSQSERELRQIQEIGQDQGVLEEEENLLVERAFRLDERTAWDVMTPRVDIFAWKDGLSLSEIVEELPDVPYSRVPVYGDSVDDVTGILYVREAYEAIVEGRHDMLLSDLAHEPFFVPGSLSLAKLLQAFQARRIHMGIVADEFGGIDGLVTLEDVLEELVGEIVDEWDVDEEELTHLSPDELVAEAGADIRDINDAFGVALPLDEHRSLNGFILEELGYVPSAGEILEHSGVRIEILEATDTQVVQARLTRIPGHAEETEPELEA